LMNRFSPANDPVLKQNYDRKTIKNKTENKIALQKELELQINQEIMMIALIGELSDQNDGEMILESLPALIELGFQIVIRGRGSKKYQTRIESLLNMHPLQIAVVNDDSASLRKLYAAADVGIITYYDKEMEETLAQILSYGLVPISTNHPDLANFDPINEKGNAFIIKRNNTWQLIASIVRANENYKFSYDWKNLQKSVMKTKLS
nr:hypothetical protein [Candidatus Gracilibacteria bacterium]